MLVALNDVGVVAFEDRLKVLKAQSHVFSDEDEKKGQSVRNQRVSRSAYRRSSFNFATAKRFSIARARSASRTAAFDVEGDHDKGAFAAERAVS